MKKLEARGTGRSQWKLTQKRQEALMKGGIHLEYSAKSARWSRVWNERRQLERWQKMFCTQANLVNKNFKDC